MGESVGMVITQLMPAVEICDIPGLPIVAIEPVPSTFWSTTGMYYRTTGTQSFMPYLSAPD